MRVCRACRAAKSGDTKEGVKGPNVIHVQRKKRTTTTKHRTVKRMTHMQTVQVLEQIAKSHTQTHTFWEILGAPSCKKQNKIQS